MVNVTFVACLLLPFDPPDPPDPQLPNLLDFLKDPLHAIFGMIVNIIPNLITGVLKFIATGILEGMIGTFTKVLEGIVALTSVDLTNPGVLAWYSRMFGLGLLLCIGFLALQLVSTSIKMQQISGVVEAGKAFVTAVIGTVLLVPFANLANLLVEGLSIKTLQLAEADKNTAVKNFLNVFLDSDPTKWFLLFTGLAGGIAILLSGLILTIILGFCMNISMLVLMAVFVLRDMLLVLVLVTGPVAIAGKVWSPTSAWPRKWGTAFVALLFTKFGVALVFAVGLSMMAHTTSKSGFKGIFLFLAAIAMTTLACMVPIMAFRFFDFLGEAAIGGMDSQLMSSGKASVGRAVNNLRSLNNVVAGSRKAPRVPPPSQTTNTTQNATASRNTTVTGGVPNTGGGKTYDQASSAAFNTPGGSVGNSEYSTNSMNVSSPPGGSPSPSRAGGYTVTQPIRYAQNVKQATTSYAASTTPPPVTPPPPSGDVVSPPVNSGSTPPPSTPPVTPPTPSTVPSGSVPSAPTPRTPGHEN